MKSFSIKMLINTIIIAGLMLTGLNCSSSPTGDLNLQMEQVVAKQVEKDNSIKNCALAVSKGDDSYSWAGAAGIANQYNQTSMTKDTPICIASITKLYTATVIMKLYEEDRLSLDDPMSKYLPAALISSINVFNGVDYSNDITIGQLLSHTSGIADYYDGKSPVDGKSLFEVFVENPDRKWTVDDTIARARDDLEPNFPPGTDASYSDTNFQLLGKIIENVTQKPLQTCFQDYIFSPLGLKSTYLIGYSESQINESPEPADVYYDDTTITKIRSNGTYWADGGIISTIDEMITFLKALNEGVIIRKDTLELMHNWHKLDFPMEYGYGTMYFKLPGIMSKLIGLTPLWGHSGSTGSFLYYSEELDLYIAGTIDNVDSNMKTFMFMGNVMKLFGAN